MQSTTSANSGAPVAPSATLAPSPPSRSADALIQLHGSALFCLAQLILADREHAEFVTEQAIWDACSGPVDTATTADRRELARYVYVRCVRRTGNGGFSSSTATTALGDGVRNSPDKGAAFPVTDEAPALSSRQRAVIGLGLFGQLTYTEIACLTNLPKPEVIGLLRSGLYALKRGQVEPSSS